MPPHPIPLPHFRAELTSVLANQGIDADGHPFNFLPVVATEADGHLTGLVVMSTSVDSDKPVQLSVTDTRVTVPATVNLQKGHSNGTFDIVVSGFFPGGTDVQVIAVAPSFFAAPAKILTLRIRQSLG